VAAGELIFRPDVEDGRRPAAQAVEQFITRYRLEFVARSEKIRDHARDFGIVALADPAECAEQPDHHIVAGEPIEDPFALSPALHERGAPKELQVARRVRHRQPRPRSEFLDAALSLAEMFEQFEPMRMPEGLRDLGKAGEYPLFRTHV
jgi:hypothetical protein